MCIKYFFAHPPSPGSTFVSSLLSPPSPSPTITYSISWNLHIFTRLDRLQHPLIKFRFQNHPIRSSPPSTRLFVFRARSAFFCPPRGKGKNKDSKFTEQERKKKKANIKRDHHIVKQLYHYYHCSCSTTIAASPPFSARSRKPNFEPNPFFALPTTSAKRPRLNCSRPGPGSFAPTGTQVSLWTSNWSVRSLRCHFVLEPRCAHSRFSDVFLSLPLASHPALSAPFFPGNIQLGGN